MPVISKEKVNNTLHNVIDYSTSFCGITKILQLLASGTQPVDIRTSISLPLPHFGLIYVSVELVDLALSLWNYMTIDAIALREKHPQYKNGSMTPAEALQHWQTMDKLNDAHDFTKIFFKFLMLILSIFIIANTATLDPFIIYPVLSFFSMLNLHTASIQYGTAQKHNELYPSETAKIKQEQALLNMVTKFATTIGWILLANLHPAGWIFLVITAAPASFSYNLYRFFKSKRDDKREHTASAAITQDQRQELDLAYNMRVTT